jgi:CHAT domain-containing protein
MHGATPDESQSQPRPRTIRSAILLIVLFSLALVFYLFGADLYSQYEIRRLIDSAYSARRPGGARLFGTQYVRVDPQPAALDQQLGRAQVLLLRLPESQARQELQRMLYLASEDWQAFIDSVNALPPNTKPQAATINNLGTAFLAKSKNNPIYLVKALQQFEQASQLAPGALEPRFNLVITYRKLRLPDAARERLSQYATSDSSSPWHHELLDSPEFDQPHDLQPMRQAADGGNITEAKRLFDQDPEYYRRIAMAYGLFNVPESEAVLRFIGDHIEERYKDNTVSAMLKPLLTDKRNLVIRARQHVREGADRYLRGELRESLQSYDKAQQLVQQIDSPFDRLWVDINRVDTQIRLGEFDSARQSLRSFVPLAQRYKFGWLLAKALSVYGSSRRLTSSHTELMQVLSEAERIFTDIGSSYDRVRPLYYLAVYKYIAGDYDEALKLALECLQLTSDDDTVRVSTLDFLIGSILYRQGSTATAVLFERESVDQAKQSKNPGLEATAASTLAQLYESIAEPDSAEKYLRVAEDAFQKVAGPERARAEAFLNIVKAKFYLDRMRYKDAESLLERNLSIYSAQPFKPSAAMSQTLMLLAENYTRTGRLKEASQKFTEAVDIVENDDQYLETEKLRIKFDDERRDLYDSAIEFEYAHGSPDAAWTYLQKYRAKMFLEFLAHFDFNIQQIRSQALDRSKVQRLVPKDAQVIEYAVLKDRLLIWVISDKVFTLRSVKVTRPVLEAKVAEVLQKLRAGADATQGLEELGSVLVDPIGDLLDPDRSLAIVPDRALHGLPFAALRRPGSKRYLIQSYPIMVSPSLTYLLASDAAPPQRDAIVGFGSQNDEWSEMFELSSLQKIYPRTTTFVGQTVDKPVFLAAMNTAPVFHYAGHSVTDAVDPLRSSILLDGNRYGPNSVTAVDVAQQRLWKNAVVVLSSCDSSVGNSRDGVGMRGLTSAFLIGGAGSVVGSLWPVEAASTAELMIAFHRAFATTRLPVATALRQAQLNFIESSAGHANPYSWSGFVVTGNFSALR